MSKLLMCANPFKKLNHIVKDNLVNFPKSLKENYPFLSEEAKVCLKCKLELYSSRKKNIDVDCSLLPDAKKSKLNDENCNNAYHKAGVAVLNQIKEKFKESTDKKERILLLTLSPKFWSRRDLQSEFSCTEWEARRAKELMTENGILVSPEKKKGKIFSKESEEIVKNFYESDDVSRLMPGMKDFLSVKGDDGKRVHVQKRLLLGDMNELYTEFKKLHENVKIGFTKFTQLRPPHCVLAGSSGTHNVCVCVHHENFKLMLDGANLDNLSKNTRTHFKNYHDYIDAIVCTNQSDACFLGDCLNCPNTAELKKTLIEIFENNDIHEVTFENWTQTDRCSVVTITMNIHAYVNELSDKLMKLKTHDFIAKKQSFFINDLKKNLSDGEFIVCCDFAENYAFVVQNSAQSFHWNNNQATIFTVIIYFKTNDELKHKSLAIISNNLAHDAVAVYVYQKIIINYLKENYDPKKIYYVTDGAAQHFKNQKNFANLLNHEKDFGIIAEWHFHATAHGKGGCDGVGSNLKRGARRASLQRSSTNHILNAEDLFNWAKQYCKETEVFYSKKEDYDQAMIELTPRFNKSFAIPGTKQCHAFIPTSEGKLIVKKFSSATEYKIFPQLKKTKNIIKSKSNLKNDSKSKKIPAKLKSKTVKSKSKLKRK